MTLAIINQAIEPTQVGFLVVGDWCDRCGDQNYRADRVCLTCTYPDDPCSRAYVEASLWDAARLGAPAAHGASVDHIG